jgi:hypothetical protein
MIYGWTREWGDRIRYTRYDPEWFIRRGLMPSRTVSEARQFFLIPGDDMLPVGSF